ncbi:hypothetical protein VKT23_015471 [Stygiomarasmius scandens]|uniref:Chromatin modification-related protein n=1 Tax=Marasmiellus scandens TaxID=2682957 RepID=A0ABR1J0Z9_9AGAR
MSAAAAAQNMEDAANLATEFIYSIDNVPAEVKHYLEEIKHKDAKCQELQHQIDSESARYIKQSLKASGFTLSSSRSLSPSPSSSPGPFSSIPVSSSQISTKVAQLYSEIEKLTHEKIALSQKVIDLLTRTCKKLDIDLHKVKVLSGEISEGSVPGTSASVPTTPGASASASISLAGAGSGLGGTAVSTTGGSVSGWTGNSDLGGLDTPVTPLAGTGRRQSAVNAAAGISASLGGGSSASLPSNKKRRVTATTSAASPSIKLPASGHSRSGSPATTSTHHNKSSTHTRSRLSRQIHPAPTRARRVDIQDDEDAEGDDDADADADADGDADVDMDGGEGELDGEGEEEDEGDDDSLYCICQRKSFGDMIACDNESDCPYEWFHLSCVGLSKPLPDVWYCTICEPKFRGTTGSSGASASTNVSSAQANKVSSSRKGRKK